MAERDEPGLGKLLGFLAVFLVVGAPMVGFLWHTLNEILAGDDGRLVVFVPVLLVFVAFLVLFGRQVQRLAVMRRTTASTGGR
jgi:hypothetical protein